MTTDVRPCPIFRPDHNGECLLCDEWADAHTPEAVALGERLAESDVGMVARLREELVKANLKVESCREAATDMATKLQLLINVADERGMLGDEHVFTFPDGDVWEAKRGV